MNSELNIKCTIWEKETFELIDYYSKETIETRINVNTSGVLSRTNKTITFTPGENLGSLPSDLITIKKNLDEGKYIIDCGNWSKDLYKLVEEQGAFMVFRGISFKEINNNLSSRYYKLSQGDIIKIGRIYFKVLDIHTKKNNIDIKSNPDSTIRGTMMRSSSYNSIVVNGQEIIRGAFSPNKDKKNLNDLYLTGNAKLNQDKNSLFGLENSNLQKIESLDYTIKNKEPFLSKVDSSKELFSISKKKQKIDKDKDKIIDKANEKNNKNEQKIKMNEKNNIKEENTKNLKNKPICRICYGDDTTEDNPLICPCICKGSMKYIHYECLKNWLNSKIEEDISIDSDNPEVETISYNRKDISCELCKEKLPDYVKHNDRYYNISFYKPKFEEFIVLESMRADKHKAKFIHILSFDKKNSINIGRANECELSISELSVSRFHCIIHKDEGDLFLEDNSSKFGTLILIQNNNMYMNDYIPLRVQINKTYIKFKIVLPFRITCCKDPFTYETRKYDYQIQNRKCFDILSYFIIKEDDPNEADDKEEEIIQDLIDEDNKKNENEDKNNNKDINKNKDLIDDKIEEESIKKNLDIKSEAISEHLDIKGNTNRIKRINIKKGKNDTFELPHLDKINIEQFRDSISLIADKELKRSPKNNNINNGQQSKQISLIKLNKREGNYDRTNANPNMVGNSTGPVFSTIVNDYNNKNKNK